MNHHIEVNNNNNNNPIDRLPTSTTLDDMMITMKIGQPT